jgi:hypothetical protein
MPSAAYLVAAAHVRPRNFAFGPVASVLRAHLVSTRLHCAGLLQIRRPSCSRLLASDGLPHLSPAHAQALLEGADEDQVRMMEERIILTDYFDNPIGAGSKKDSESRRAL